MTTILRIRSPSKTFVLHARGSTVLPVPSGVHLSAAAGECVALDEGVAVVGVFHDGALRHEIITRTVQIASVSRVAA